MLKTLRKASEISSDMMDLGGSLKRCVRCRTIFGRCCEGQCIFFAKVGTPHLSIKPVLDCGYRGVGCHILQFCSLSRVLCTSYVENSSPTPVDRLSRWGGLLDQHENVLSSICFATIPRRTLSVRIFHSSLQEKQTSAIPRKKILPHTSIHVCRCILLMNRIVRVP